MANKKPVWISKAALADLRARAASIRRQFEHKPGPDELLTQKERKDAAPFYFVLRGFIRELKEAREGAGLTLADISHRTGIAVESLSRLETGAQTNPTWKTLGLYAKALARRPELSLSQQVRQVSTTVFETTITLTVDEGATFTSTQSRRWPPVPRSEARPQEQKLVLS